MKLWWEKRAVPTARKDMEKIMRASGCPNGKVYLAKNLGLSLTDTYWLCPLDIFLRWEDVNLYDHSHLSGSMIPYHNQTSYDQNASLGGSLSKCWDISGQPPVLVKKTYEHFGMQSVNEVFASLICRRQQIPSSWFTEYIAQRTDDGGLQSRCRAFTNEHMELVPAYEVLESAKQNNQVSNYDAYILICEQHGLNGRLCRDFIDFQTQLDFVISNTDRHLLNFGILRNPDNGEFIAPAPIFDNGNSMHYQDHGKHYLSQADLLDEPVTSFYTKPEKMMACVRNRSLLNVNLLPSAAEARDFYTQYGVPEQNASIIAANYELKKKMFVEWQKGQTLSVYIEKQAQKRPERKNRLAQPPIMDRHDAKSTVSDAHIGKLALSGKEYLVFHGDGAMILKAVEKYGIDHPASKFLDAPSLSNGDVPLSSVQPDDIYVCYGLHIRKAFSAEEKIPGEAELPQEEQEKIIKEIENFESPDASDRDLQKNTFNRSADER